MRPLFKKTALVEFYFITIAYLLSRRPPAIIPVELAARRF
jgi:hypothetical protein